MRTLFFSLVIIFCSLFLFILPKNAYALDTCQGYDNTRTAQQGICFYYSAFSPGNYSAFVEYSTPIANFTFPSCTEMVKNGTTLNPKDGYHHITDEIHNCAVAWGLPSICCAPDKNAQIQNAPPPPCKVNKHNQCVTVDTGLGTLSVSPGNLVGSIFSVVLGISGGVALILIIISGYQILFAQADPEKLTAARERLTSAIIGLLFIIFSIVIIQIIGVNILHIPGLNK